MSQRTRSPSNAGTTFSSGEAAARSLSTIASAVAVSADWGDTSSEYTAESGAVLTGSTVGAGGR